jgi:hypothetical protein
LKAVQQEWAAERLLPLELLQGAFALLRVAA